MTSRHDMTRNPRYRILPHTADGKFRAYGRTLEEAFGNAALAMVSLMWDWTTIEPLERREIRVEGPDRERLLVRFLGEIVYLFDHQCFLLGRVAELGIAGGARGGLELRAVVEGEPLRDGREIHGDVKAVTYHDLMIEAGDGFTVQVVVDM
jgi:SHS2 domain-containing protein